MVGLEVGTIFAGDYRVVRPLSEGGMGAVWVVEQISTSKERALKLMHPQLVADASLRKRFEQEAQVGARIRSEHVVEVQAAGVDAATGTPYLVMELLHGQDLATRIHERGPMQVAELVLVFEQLCHAVGAAHRAGVVHRDLKPENIFLAESMRAGASVVIKVLDFGIAKVAAEADARSKATAAMGSPMWMSPEQTERGPVTPTADVWALGLIAFFALTGKPYWRAANTDDTHVAQLMREILFEPMQAPSVRAREYGGASLPPWFDAWFFRCTSRDPRARIADASQAFAELSAATAQSHGVPAVNVTPPPYVQPTPVTPASPTSGLAPVGLVVGLAFIALAIAGGGWVAWSKFHQHHEEDTSRTATLAPATTAPVVATYAPLIPSATQVSEDAATTSASPVASSASKPTSAAPTTHSTIHEGSVTVSGGLPAEVIKRIVRQNFGVFRLCYDNGLRSNPSLAGPVVVKFVIGHDGSVSTTADGGSTLPDHDVVACVVRRFGNLSYPQPAEGIVTVSYALSFSTGS